MTRKRRRLGFVVAGMVLLGAAAALVLSAFEDNLVFFYSPSDVAARDLPPDRRVRIGGLVEEASVVRSGLTTRFRVTDTAHVRLGELPWTAARSVPRRPRDRRRGRLRPRGAVHRQRGAGQA